MFRNMGREYNFQQNQRMNFNDEFVGPNKFNPKFSQVESNGAKVLTFSPLQQERRTLYFEGDNADLVHTQNRCDMLKRLWAEQVSHRDQPVKTLESKRASPPPEVLSNSQAIPRSTATAAKTFNSADLRSDGICWDLRPPKTTEKNLQAETRSSQQKFY